MRYWIPCFAIILLAVVDCQAAPLGLNETQASYLIGTSMFIMEDPDGVLTIAEVTQPAMAARFTPCREERPNFGYTHSAYWVRMTVQNQAIQRDLWLVEMLFANLHYVDFYRPAPDGHGYLSVKTGVMRPASTRDVDHHRFFFRLPVAPGDTQTFYLRVQNGASMTLATQIVTLEAYTRKIRGEYLFLGLFLATVFMLGFYSMFLWYSLRKLIFLYYVLSIIGIVCWFLAYSGVGAYYLWSGILALNRYVIFWGGGSFGIIALQFTILSLQITRRQRFSFGLCRFLQLALLSVMLGSWLMAYGQVIWLFNLIALGGALAVVLVGVWRWVQGFHPARDYILAIGLGGGWMVVLPLVRLGVVPSTLLTEHALEIGTMGFAFVWAFMLMRQVTFLRQEQEQAVTAFQESERKFKDIAQKIPGVIYQFRVRRDGSSYFSYASPRAQELFGLPEDLSRQEWKLGARIHPADRQAFFASSNQAIATCSDWNYEGRIILPDGRLKWLQGISSPTRVGDELVFDGILLDITERKQAEEKIKSSEQRYRALFDHALDGILILDAEGQIVAVNAAFASMHGYTIAEMGNLTMRDLDTPAAAQHFPARMQGVKNGKPLHFEVEHYHKDGHIFALDVVSNRIEVDGKLYALSFHRDITERKQAEEQIRQLNAELETRVRQRTAELETANKELQSFAYVVSHDLKTPLRGISHLAHWLLDDYAPAFDDKGKDMVNLLIGRVQRMDDLIEGILEYSRVGRVVGEEKLVDLDPLVKEIIGSLAPADHIRITVEQQLPVIIGDRIRILQVFQNLIGNAVKYMDKPAGTITIGCTDGGSHWTFRVADNGPGIEQKYHEKIFQIFQTLHPRDQHESTGIGLALVKKIVELYGGRVWVESTPGQGSTFCFTWRKS